MKEEIKGLYAAICLSVIIIVAVNHFLPANSNAPTNSENTVEVMVEERSLKTDDADPITEQTKPLEVDEIVNAERRLTINNPALSGSIRLKGARFDHLSLNKYKQTLEPDSADVELLFPARSNTPYFAEFGWLSAKPDLKLPDQNTLWKTKAKVLGADTPVVLEYDNGQGLKFVRTIRLDENYLFHITQTVVNNTDQNLVLYPYGLISRKLDPNALQSRSVVHEGISGVIDGSLKEIKYKDLNAHQAEVFDVKDGWAGFSDRYWFTAFILDQSSQSNFKFSGVDENTYQVDYRGSAVSLGAGETVTNEVRFFAGAKEIELLDRYTKQENIKKFDLAVDFGWYYFLTKPFFYILEFLYKIIGNMGWAILLFAALLRLIMFPIANKSYESMSKMKKVQPKIMEIQEKFKNNKVLLQQKTLELYKREKINPASGCLPMFIQIPVFFSLYKVLNIAIEIRHAPFIGWIKDLSAPDPLTISVWSHIPYIPALLDIGVWPILMGLTMWLQQKLQPAPANKDQARMFALMPFIFTLMLGHFASGLVIYWTLSNILSIMQQKAIMHKYGVK